MVGIPSAPSPAGAPVARAISAPTEYSFISSEINWGVAAGGIGSGEGFIAHTLFYVGVDNVASALELARRLGATIVLDPQRNEEGQVTVGHFRDPAGNLVGVAGPL